MASEILPTPARNGDSEKVLISVETLDLLLHYIGGEKALKLLRNHREALKLDRAPMSVQDDLSSIALAYVKELRKQLSEVMHRES